MRASICVSRSQPSLVDFSSEAEAYVEAALSSTAAAAVASMALPPLKRVQKLPCACSRLRSCCNTLTPNELVSGKCCTTRGLIAWEHKHSVDRRSTSLVRSSQRWRWRQVQALRPPAATTCTPRSAAQVRLDSCAPTTPYGMYIPCYTGMGIGTMTMVLRVCAAPTCFMSVASTSSTTSLRSTALVCAQAQHRITPSQTQAATVNHGACHAHRRASSQPQSTTVSHSTPHTHAMASHSQTYCATCVCQARRNCI